MRKHNQAQIVDGAGAHPANHGAHTSASHSVAPWLGAVALVAHNDGVGGRTWQAAHDFRGLEAFQGSYCFFNTGRAGKFG